MVRIGHKAVGEPGYCMIVAEIGINHNGDLKIAKKLIDEAVVAGCDAVKFQKRTIPVVYSAKELAAPRQVPEDIISKALERGVLPEENRKRLESEGFKATTNGDQKWCLEFSRSEYE